MIILLLFFSLVLILILNLKWHARLGHIGKDRMSRLAKEGLLAYSLRLSYLDVSRV